MELAQAQERLRAAKEAWEKRQEERKETGGGEKSEYDGGHQVGCGAGCGTGSGSGAKDPTSGKSQFLSSAFHWRLTSLQQDLEVSVMTRNRC